MAILTPPPENFKAPSKDIFAKHSFQPVILLPSEYDVFDFSKNYDPLRQRQDFGIGKYDENRPTMYDQEMYQTEEEPRTLHVGVDIGCPSGTPVYAFTSGRLLEQKEHSEEGNYGPTLITEHTLEPGVTLYALWGHLSRESLKLRSPDQRFEAGDTLGFVGTKNENGGWNPHLHFQLSWLKPENCDLPGVVPLSQRNEWLNIFPDPRLVLGPIY